MLRPICEIAQFMNQVPLVPSSWTVQLVCPVHELGKKNIAQFMNCAVLVHEKYIFIHGDQNVLKAQ